MFIKLIKPIEIINSINWLQNYCSFEVSDISNEIIKKATEIPLFKGGDKKKIALIIDQFL